MDSPTDNPTDSPDVDPVKARKVVAFALASLIFVGAAVVLLVLGLIQTISTSTDAGKVVMDGLPKLIASVVFSLLALGTYELASRTRKEMKR